MIVDTAETKCATGVLEILIKGKSTYNEMFRKTKVSHTTLQKVLFELEKANGIKKNSNGRLETEYEITNKGKEILTHLIYLSKNLQ